MSVKEDKIVMPGDKIGIIEQYLPGEGTYNVLKLIKKRKLYQ